MVDHMRDKSQSGELEAQVALLQRENQRLAEQIKRLVHSEHDLYQLQMQLDNQIRVYRQLYELGKQLNATLDSDVMLERACEFVLYQLNFERCLVLCFDAVRQQLEVQTIDGFYDPAEHARVAALSFPLEETMLASTLYDTEYLICQQDDPRPELAALSRQLGMDEWVAFGLGGDRSAPVGILIAGNTAVNRQYHARIAAESEYVVGLSSLVAQVSTSIHMSREVQAREQRLALEARSRERIDQELRVARLIQRTLLPKEMPAPRGWQIARHYQPAREVGGDFYDLLPLPDGRLGLVIGDVAGKGVPAALLMAITRSVLRAVAQRHTSAGGVLTEANTILCPDVPRNMFVTCFYAILDPETGWLQYANAGHTFPYHWRGANAVELEAVGFPMGVLPTTRYAERATTLRPGHRLLFYSDGLIEAHEPRRAMFGFRRLERMLAQHAASGEALIDAVLDELARFVGDGWEQEDDITLLTIQRSA